MFSAKQMSFIRVREPYANNGFWSNSSDINYRIQVSSPPIRLIDVTANTGYTVEFHYYPTVNANVVSSVNNPPGPGNYQSGLGTNWTFGPSIKSPGETQYTAVLAYVDANNLVQRNISTTANTIPSNTWTTYALVASPNGANTDMSIYVNGVREQIRLDDTGSYANIVTITHDILAQTSRRFTMGGITGAGTTALRGHVDELRVSNIARYTESTYQIPSYQFTADSNTVLLVHFNGSNGSTSITDSSSSNLTVTNNSNLITISNVHANLS